MAQVIGIVKLAPGEVGFYDEISKIHLTMSKPKAEVYDYMNTAKLIRAVRNKVLVLIAGSLNAARVVNEETPAKKKSVPTLITEEVKIEEPQIVMFKEEVEEPNNIQPLIEETEVLAETAEEVIQEEVVEIAQPKKKSAKKKKKEEE